MVKDGWEEDRGGSSMFRVSRQLASTRYEVFKWCRDFRSRNGIVWDDFTKECEEAQLGDTSVSFAKNEERVRKEVRERLDIQLHY